MGFTRYFDLESVPELITGETDNGLDTQEQSSFYWIEINFLEGSEGRILEEVDLNNVLDSFLAPKFNYDMEFINGFKMTSKVGDPPS